MTDKKPPIDAGLDQAQGLVDNVHNNVDSARTAATQTVDSAKRKVDAAKRTMDSAKKSVAKVQKLTTDARNVVAAILNMFTSIAVVISVLLGAKNVNVADRQLSLANEQLAALDAAESRSTARSAEWLKALERMRVEQAVESGVPALVAQFEPPDELIRNQPAEKVEIAVQSLLNEPLNGRISVEVKGSRRSMMCMLPGCMDARLPGCSCHDPLHYDFVLQPRHLMSVGLPMTLQPDPAARCSEELKVDFEIELQDAKGRMESLDKRRLTYRRSGGSGECGPDATYRYLSGDSWGGKPVEIRRSGGGDDDDADDDGAEEPGDDAGVSDAGALDASPSGADALDAGAGEDGEESPE